MKTFLLAIPVLLLAAPVQATGGLTCRTAGPSAIAVSVGFGHVAGAQLLSDTIRLTDSGRQVPVAAPQWWFDGTELRLLLINPAATRNEAIIKARRTGTHYDGSIWRNGKRRWLRCREG